MLHDAWLCDECYKRCVFVEVEEYTDTNIALKECWICETEMGKRHVTDLVAALWPLVSKIMRKLENDVLKLQRD